MNESRSEAWRSARDAVCVAVDALLDGARELDVDDWSSVVHERLASLGRVCGADLAPAVTTSAEHVRAGLECIRRDWRATEREEVEARLVVDGAVAHLRRAMKMQAALHGKAREMRRKADELLESCESASVEGVCLAATEMRAIGEGRSADAVPPRQLERAASSSLITAENGRPRTLDAKARSGTLWAAGSASIQQKNGEATTPTLGRHKSVRARSESTSALAASPPTDQRMRDAEAKLHAAKRELQRSKETEQLAREGMLCTSCRIRGMARACTECWDGQCLDVKCAGLYTLRSVGETKQRFICKTCIGVLRAKIVASRAETLDGKARLPAVHTELEADNPMFLAAQMRRRQVELDGGDWSEGDDYEIPVAVEEDDPFDDFSWTGDDK